MTSVPNSNSNTNTPKSPDEHELSGHKIRRKKKPDVNSVPLVALKPNNSESFVSFLSAPNFTALLVFAKDQTDLCKRPLNRAEKGCQAAHSGQTQNLPPGPWLRYRPPKPSSPHVSHLGGREARSQLLPLSSFERKFLRFIKEQSVLTNVLVTKMRFGVRTPGHCLQPGARGLQLLPARRPTQLPLVSGSVDPGSTVARCQGSSDCLQQTPTASAVLSSSPTAPPLEASP